MYFLPYLLNNISYFRPSRIMDQDFSLVSNLEDLLQPLTVPRLLLISPAGYTRN